jgi:hypothetical protein
MTLKYFWSSSLTICYTTILLYRRGGSSSLTICYQKSTFWELCCFHVENRGIPPSICQPQPCWMNHKIYHVLIFPSKKEKLTKQCKAMKLTKQCNAWLGPFHLLILLLESKTQNSGCAKLYRISWRI